MTFDKTLIAFGQVDQNLANFEDAAWLCIRMCFLMALFIIALMTLGWAVLACAEKVSDAHNGLVKTFNHGGPSSGPVP
jgi:hypothetical protein